MLQLNRLDSLPLPHCEVDDCRVLVDAGIWTRQHGSSLEGRDRYLTIADGSAEAPGTDFDGKAGASLSPPARCGALCTAGPQTCWPGTPENHRLARGYGLQFSDCLRERKTCLDQMGARAGCRRLIRAESAERKKTWPNSREPPSKTERFPSGAAPHPTPPKFLPISPRYGLGPRSFPRTSGADISTGSHNSRM